MFIQLLQLTLIHPLQHTDKKQYIITEVEAILHLFNSSPGLQLLYFALFIYLSSIHLPVKICFSEGGDRRRRKRRGGGRRKGKEKRKKEEKEEEEEDLSDPITLILQKTTTLSPCL